MSIVAEGKFLFLNLSVVDVDAHLGQTLCAGLYSKGLTEARPKGPYLFIRVANKPYD